MARLPRPPPLETRFPPGYPNVPPAGPRVPPKPKGPKLPKGFGPRGYTPPLPDWLKRALPGGYEIRRPVEIPPPPRSPQPQRETRPITVPSPAIPAPSSPPAPEIPWPEPEEVRLPPPPPPPPGVPPAQKTRKTKIPGRSSAQNRPILRRYIGHVAAGSLLENFFRQQTQRVSRIAREELLRRVPGQPIDLAPGPEVGIAPQLTNPLTGVNPSALGLAQQQPLPQQRRQREKECKCEDPEDTEEKREARASSVVAKVRAYARRMSQNSLDNLR